MRRRDFIKWSGSAALAAVAGRPSDLMVKGPPSQPAAAPTFYVSAQGDDNHPGTASLPFATLPRAQRAAREARNTSEPAKVVILEGTYYLETALTFRPEDSGTHGAPVMYAAQTGHHVTISGGRKLGCNWKPYQNGIMMTDVPAGLTFTQLFVNGKRQIRARYPNYDPSVPGRSGYLLAAGAIPHDAANPFAGPDEDMTFSTEAPRGIRFRPFHFLPAKVVEFAGRRNSYLSSGVLGELALDHPGN